jgi:hypothetical protein
MATCTATPKPSCCKTDLTGRAPLDAHARDERDIVGIVITAIFIVGAIALRVVIARRDASIALTDGFV